ncbi:MAG: hypothetical protein ABJZ55_00900 [Fuerstiella sp.]
MTESATAPSGLRALLPSGAISICVHLILVVVAGMSLKGCEQGVPVQAGGAEFHEIGLAFINDTADNKTAIAAANPSDTEIEQPAEAEAEDVTKQEELPMEAPNIEALLNPSTANSQSPSTVPSPLDLSNIIGVGPTTSADASASQKQPKKPAGTSGQTTAGSPTPGPGETAFMDIIGSGDSFVYLIDVSSSMSMSNNRRLNLAKSQLVNSLTLLKRNQQFQVFFYSDYVEALRLRQRPQEDLYQATSVNIQLAESSIRAVRAHGGTSHLPALKRALALSSDVIYFLTDGDEPRLLNSELNQVRELNRGRSQIHVVEFASGPLESRRATWLHQLAKQSGGKYRRVQVK